MKKVSEGGDDAGEETRERIANFAWAWLGLAEGRRGEEAARLVVGGGGEEE